MICKRDIVWLAFKALSTVDRVIARILELLCSVQYMGESEWSVARIQYNAGGAMPAVTSLRSYLLFALAFSNVVFQALCL